MSREVYGSSLEDLSHCRMLVEVCVCVCECGEHVLYIIKCISSRDISSSLEPSM